MRRRVAERRRVWQAESSPPISSKMRRRSYQEVSIFYSQIPSVIFHKMEFRGFCFQQIEHFSEMENRGSERKGKRIRDDGEEDDNLALASKQEETPAFARVLLEAMKSNWNCPYLKLAKHKIPREALHIGNWERILHIIFNEELMPRLGSSNPSISAGGSVVVHRSTSSAPRIPGSGGQKLQLCVETKMPTSLFSGETITGEGGSVIYVYLMDMSNGSVVQTGPASDADLNVVVLEGDFNEEIRDGWEHDFFKSRRVKEREGRRPILVGPIRVKLKGGEGILANLSFTDNSSWTRSKKFRLGVELASGFYNGIRVMEAKTNAIRVKDQRGKAYEKRSIPALHDEVWRLINIAKGGTLHKNLLAAGITIVEDLLRQNAKDPQRLRTILGKGMTDRMWKATIKHAMTFSPIGDKFYIYYTDGTKSSGIIFNHIYQPLDFITDRQVAPLESLGQNQKKFLVKKAYENWGQVVECDEQFLSSFTTSEEMQDCPAEPAYPRNHNITPTQTGHTFHSDQQIQPDYASVPQLIDPPFSSSDPETRSPENNRKGLEDLFDWLFEAEPQPVYRAANAVVGWLNIKVALKWGMKVRSRAAKKRLKLTELD